MLIEHAALREAIKRLRRSADVTLHLTEYGATVTACAETFTLACIVGETFPNVPAERDNPAG